MKLYKIITIDHKNYFMRAYTQMDLVNLSEFYRMCLPQSGRYFDKYGVHVALLDVDKNFEYFLCLKNEENEQIIGTCALKRIDEKRSELKYVYLYKRYHGLGLGTIMCQKVIDMAKLLGYKEIYLDTISETSGSAIKMYKRLGFELTEKYHEAVRADVFMKLLLE